eukprot:763932-Hanusia_phi.AAC.10
MDSLVSLSVATSTCKRVRANCRGTTEDGGCGEEGRSCGLLDIQDDLIVVIMQHSDARAYGRLSASCRDLQRRCELHQAVLFRRYLMSSFGVLFGETEVCWDSGYALVKIAIPSLALVMEIRGKSSAVSCDGYRKEMLATQRPWDGNTGSIQEFLFGFTEKKSSSYKQAFRESLSMKINSHSNEMKNDLESLTSQSVSLIKTIRGLRCQSRDISVSLQQYEARKKKNEQLELLERARQRSSQDWEPSAVRWAQRARAENTGASTVNSSESRKTNESSSDIAACMKHLRDRLSDVRKKLKERLQEMKKVQQGIEMRKANIKDCERKLKILQCTAA